MLNVTSEMAPNQDISPCVYGQGELYRENLIWPLRAKFLHRYLDIYRDWPVNQHLSVKKVSRLQITAEPRGGHLKFWKMSISCLTSGRLQGGPLTPNIPNYIYHISYPKYDMSFYLDIPYFIRGHTIFLLDIPYRGNMLCPPPIFQCSAVGPGKGIIINLIISCMHGC